MSTPTSNSTRNDAGGDGADDSRAFRFPTSDHHPAQPLESGSTPAARAVTAIPEEQAIDHGIEESFPASDPVSVSVSKSMPVSAAPAPTRASAPRTPARTEMQGLAAGIVFAGGALALAAAAGYLAARRRH
ncbi:hypothetical protein [Variovorax sp. Root411]|uniref:hypothetical protein n=1 Tax=Variovorax sp. Root411 TaxID=1736530 RepID=UPI0007004B7C|nr:hypothetical protein [Variovorax sp. Root411]KQW54332.1 hypothetical protein ASC92_20070 [Variovorax sp. Root411]